MASAAPRPTLPIARRETLRLAPPPEPPDRRRRRALLLAAVTSLLLHVVLVILAFRVVTTAPVPPAEPAPIVVHFADPPRDATPSPVPPDTDVVSDRDTAGPDEPADAEPPPSPSADPPAAPPRRAAEETKREREPQRAPSDAPGVGPREPEPEVRELTRDEKRRRVNDLLSGLGTNGWTDGDAPALGDTGEYGGGDELQFESRADVDWGPYAARIKRVVRANWRIPTAAKVGMAGIVTVHFYIARDGSIHDLEMVRSSGNVPLDVAAKDAIALSDALPPPPLPEDLDEDQVGVTWSFLYNVSDADYRAWQREQRLARKR